MPLNQKCPQKKQNTNGRQLTQGDNFYQRGDLTVKDLDHKRNLPVDNGTENKIEQHEYQEKKFQQKSYLQ
jgi:hypothetical protein